MHRSSKVVPPTIVVCESLIYASQGDISAIDARTGTLQQRYPFQGHPSHAVVDGVMYVNLDYLSEHTIQALRASDGVSLWHYRTQGRLSMAAPRIVEGVVYAATTEGEVYAFQADDGVLLWRYETGPLLVAAPTVVDGVLYAATAATPVQAQPFVYALQAGNGALLWRSAIPEASMLPLLVADETILISGHQWYALLRASDGGLLRSSAWQAMLLSSHALMAGRIYQGFSAVDEDHERASLQVGPRQQRWRGYIQALETSTGALIWRQVVGKEVEWGSPVFLTAQDAVLYASTTDGVLSAIQASDGTILWRAQFGDLLLGGPVVADGSVYVGASDGYVYALRADDGSLRWRTLAGTSVTAAAAIEIVSVHIGEPEEG